MTARRFMVPTAQVIPLYAPWSNVSSLMHFDGANGGASFPDSRGLLTWTRRSIPITSTTTAVFGQSIYFDGGSGRYIDTPYSTYMDLLPGSFTFDGWLYPTSVKTNGARVFSICGPATSWNSTTGIHILIQLATASNVLNVQLANGTASPSGLSSTLTVPINTWTHVLVQYNSSTQQIGLGINGTMKYSSALTVSRPSGNPTSAYGTIPPEAGNSATAFAGFMDECRIVKGLALCSESTYIVPSSPYTNS